MTAVLEPTAAPTPVAPTPRVRLAWRIAGSLAGAALLVGGVSQTVSLLAHEEHTEQLSFPAAGVEVVDIELNSGSVDITAADVDEISVTARISDGLRSTGHDERLEGNRLVLRGTCPLWLSTFCSVHYDVTVPREVDVRAELSEGRLQVVGTVGSIDASSSDGSISLVDVEGDVEVSSDNGSLEGDGLVADTVLADTDNGGIDLGFAEAPTFVTARSDNGSVELRLPDVDGGYRVDMDTDNGSTDLGVATDPASDRHITATTDNGNIRVLSSDGAPG
jgi:hypothetical protein